MIAICSPIVRMQPLNLGNSYVKEVMKILPSSPVVLCPKVENDLSMLNENLGEYLEMLGIKEPKIKELTLECRKTLDYINFYSVGIKESHGWIVKQGTTAVEVLYISVSSVLVQYTLVLSQNL